MEICMSRVSDLNLEEVSRSAEERQWPYLLDEHWAYELVYVALIRSEVQFLSTLHF
jgi:hypothetical protein